MSTSLVIELVDPLRLALYIVMDLGWMLYYHMMANSAAILALIIDVSYLFVTWVDSSAGARAHTLCEVFWLAGVTIWMAGDLMCNDPQRPWEGGCGMGFEDIATRVAIYVLGMGLIPLAVFYGACAVGLLRLRDSAEAPDGVRAVPSACGAKEKRLQSKASIQGAAGSPALVGGILPEGLYVRVAMAPWILKDISWAFEVGSAVTLFGLLTVLIAGDSLRRFGGATLQAQLLWFVGNAIWALCELVTWMALPGWRFVTGLIFALAACWAVLGSLNILEDHKATISERKPILSGPVAESQAGGIAADGQGAAASNLQR